MSADGKAKYLMDSLNQHLESFGKKRKENKDKAFWFKMFVTSFSAGTTILLGLQGLESITFFNASIWVKNVALVFSAFVTLFSVWDTFFNHRALWVRYTKTITQLRGVKAELEYLSSNEGKVKEEDVDRLYQKFQTILEATNAFWQSLRDENAVKNEELS